MGYYYSNYNITTTGTSAQTALWDDCAYINQSSDKDSTSYVFRVIGCGKEDVSVTYCEDSYKLSIRAKSQYTDYNRSFLVCRESLDLSAVQCSVKNGVLTIKIPKKKKQEKKVDIN